MQEGEKYVSGYPCILIKSKPVTYVSLISFYKLSLTCMFVVDLIYKFFNLVKAKQYSNKHILHTIYFLYNKDRTALSRYYYKQGKSNFQQVISRKKNPSFRILLVFRKHISACFLL